MTAFALKDKPPRCISCEIKGNPQTFGIARLCRQFRLPKMDQDAVCAGLADAVCTGLPGSSSEARFCCVLLLRVVGAVAGAGAAGFTASGAAAGASSALNESRWPA